MRLRVGMEQQPQNVQGHGNALQALLRSTKKKKLEKELLEEQRSLHAAEGRLTGVTCAEARDVWPEVCPPPPSMHANANV